MKVNLLYMTNSNRGGWATYAAHVVHGLLENDVQAQLWRVVAKQPGINPRPFGRGVMYRQATVDTLCALAKKEAVHILAADPKRVLEVEQLLRAGASITIHDPNELKEGVVDVLRAVKPRVTIIREKMREHIPCKKVTFVPHPYVRMPTDESIKERFNAVAFSRLDFDKGTHFIAAANRSLPKKLWCWLRGWEHRPYAQHKLRKVDPNWREYHLGKWGFEDLWAGVKFAMEARMVVDMSDIKGDGGGTQYTHLEALDAEKPLVLNKRWLTGTPVDKELLSVAIFTEPDHLIDVLRSKRVAKPSEKALAKFWRNHNAKLRAPEIVGL